MSANLGVIIPNLTTTTPLNAGASWTSSFVTNAYGSYSVVVYADQTSNLLVAFSGDGIHYDYTTNYLIVANIGKNITFSSLSQWVEFTLTNNGGSNQTVLRLFTYGDNNSSTVNAEISGDVTLNISTNPFGQTDVSTNQYQPICYNLGAQIPIQNLTTFSTPPILPSQMMTSVCSKNTLFSHGANGLELFLGNLQSGVTGATNDVAAFIGLDNANCYPNSTTNCIFTARFDFNTGPTAASGEYMVGLGQPSGSAVQGWYNGAAFLLGATAQTSFHGYNYHFATRLFWNNTVVNTTLQQNFNIDKLDGFGPSKIALTTGTMYTFQLQLLASGDTLYSIYNWNTKTFDPFQVYYSNNSANPWFLGGSGRFVLQCNCITAGLPTISNACFVSYFSVTTEKRNTPYTIYPNCSLSFNGMTGITGGSSVVINYAVLLENPQTFNGQYNSYSCQIKKISCLTPSNITNFIVQVFRNVTNYTPVISTTFSQYNLPILYAQANVPGDITIGSLGDQVFEFPVLNGGAVAYPDNLIMPPTGEVFVITITTLANGAKITTPVYLTVDMSLF